MQRSSIWVGSIALMLLAVAIRVEPTGTDVPRWDGYGSPTVCLAHDFTADFICADWFAPGTPEDGTLCCVASERLPNNSFDDCAKAIGNRGPRPDIPPH